MIGKLINWYCQVTVKLFAYTIGGILFGIFYCLSLVFPFFKNILNEYESVTSPKSVLFIDFFSISLISIFLVSIEKRLPIQYQDNIFSILLFYFIWIIFGYFALLALAGIKKKNRPATQKKPKNMSRNTLKKQRKKNK